MKWFFLALFICLCFHANSQMEKEFVSAGKTYFSFNPLALAEPHMAIGIGFGYRWTKRSGYFTELSYLAASPLYKDMENSLHGFRLLTHYRYHLTDQRHSKERSGLHRIRERNNSFIALEFRMKHTVFTNTHHFLNNATNDTLLNYLYTARSNLFGGAVLVGNVYDLGASGKWKLEITAGIGIKHRLVKFKKPNSDYSILEFEAREWAFRPKIYQSATTLYLPMALRLRYVLD